MNRCSHAVLLATLFIVAPALSHPPDEHGRHSASNERHASGSASMRAWTNARTGEVVWGAFLAARREASDSGDAGVKVSIELASGDVVTVALADLSDADRAEALSRIGAVRAINTHSSVLSSHQHPDQESPQSPPANDRPAPSKARYTDAWITPAVAADRVTFHTFESNAAGGKVSFHLYTPREYDDPTTARERFPVVYWLHGSQGGLAGIRTLASAFDRAIGTGAMPPALVVFVNGLAEGMYVDWKDGSTRVESVIIADLIPHIDATFRTVASRNGRVIDGFSMGGYGAARLGFKHPDLFRGVSMMGAGPMQEELTQTPRAGRQRAAEVLAKVYGGDQEYFKAASPRRWARANAQAIKAGSLVRMVVGDRDETFANNRAFHDYLVSLGIDHEWRALPGVAHDPSATLKALGGEMWAFYRAAFAPAAAPQPKEPNTPAPPPQAAPFNAFAPFVTTRWDDRWLYIESDGLPHLPGGVPGTYDFSHTMMVGITAWQQQVPLPQIYRGTNAWQIPLRPEIAKKPVSAKEQLFRGAIALAANGVPIFNPIKNDGRTDTFLAGELDEFGGHCGRADDYHYHIAPTHLQKYVGKAAPIAYALDGFPIYGLYDPAAAPEGPGADLCCPLGSREPLDELNGHYAPAPTGSPAQANGLYHYHASPKYPYLNGGMRGVVSVKNDQIDPQPRAGSPRAALPPLRGATITGFKARGEPTDPAWSLEYVMARSPHEKHVVNYRIEGKDKDTRYIFEFVSPDNTTTSQTYEAAATQRGPGRGGRREGAGRRPRDNGDRPPQREPGTPPSPEDQPAQQPAPITPSDDAHASAAAGFAITSADVVNGRLSQDCTCDGLSRAPALAWSEPPVGTRSLALVMHHIARDGDTHVYMVVADLPSTARELTSAKHSAPNSGTWGQNTVNRKTEYAPPCSQGPGDKTYTITLYALSDQAPLPSGTPLTRDALLAAIKSTTLATTTLEMKYARPADK